MANAQYRNFFTFPNDASRADFNLFKWSFPLWHHALPAWVPDTEGMVCLFKLGSVHEVAQFTFIHGGAHNHVGHTTQESQIERLHHVSPYHIHVA